MNDTTVPAAAGDGRLLKYSCVSSSSVSTLNRASRRMAQTTNSTAIPHSSRATGVGISGLAPAVILVKFCADASPEMPTPVARVLGGLAGLFVVCAILRLARFNVETDDEDTH